MDPECDDVGDDKSWEEWDMGGIELEEGSSSSKLIGLLLVPRCLMSSFHPLPVLLLVGCHLGRVGS